MGGSFTGLNMTCNQVNVGRWTLGVHFYGYCVETIIWFVRGCFYTGVDWRRWSETRGISSLAQFVWTYVNTTITLIRRKTTELRPPLLGDLQCFVPHQSAEKGWSRIKSIQALARFVCSENTSNTATGTNSLDMYCQCGQYGLVPFYILPSPRSAVWHSPSFSFNHSHLYKPHCVCAWCPTSRRMWSWAQTLMGHFTSSLHRVNLQTHFIAVVVHDTVPRCKVQPARMIQWRKGKRKGNVETDLEPIIKTVQVWKHPDWMIGSFFFLFLFYFTPFFYNVGFTFAAQTTLVG